MGPEEDEVHERDEARTPAEVLWLHSGLGRRQKERGAADQRQQDGVYKIGARPDPETSRLPLRDNGRG